MYRVWLVAVLCKPDQTTAEPPPPRRDASPPQPSAQLPRLARAWRPERGLPWLHVAAATVLAAALLRRMRASPGLAGLARMLSAACTRAIGTTAP